MSLLAKIMVEGDKHFCSKNYGGHREYPRETIYYDNLINKIIEEEGITHYINTGDLSYGRFATLEYRARVDETFAIKRKLLGNNIWVVKGNHDKASYGQTEYEYYCERGDFRPSEALNIGLGTSGGGIHIEMKDYGDKSDFTRVEGAFNLIIGHGYYSMVSDNLPNYGTPSITLDDFKPWSGVDMIIAGHIHNEHMVSGKICDKQIKLHYLPCLMRPSYHRDGMPDKGCVDIISVYDDKGPEYERYEIELLPLEVSFDLAAIKEGDDHKLENEHTKIDVADVAKRMEDYVRKASDPVMAVESMEELDPKVKEVAVELLKASI